MRTLDNEKLVNYLVVLDKPGRQFNTEEDTRWGGLLQPAPDENPSKTSEGMRVVLFGSWEFGYLVLETLKEYERRFPKKLNLAGFVTDNPLNPDAKISIKKRVWNFIDQPYRVFDETFTIESALNFNIQVYTGEIKTDSFYRLIEQWNPDAILVCVFGQIMNSRIIKIPQLGIYNFHPSNLNKNQGAGPAPYDDLVMRDADSTVWSVHQVSEEVDGGHVVGNSPPVNIRNKAGILPADPLVVYQKLGEALSPLTFFMIDELCRKFEQKKTGYIDHIDFPDLIVDEVTQRLMLPIVKENPSEMLPIPDTSFFPV